MVKSTVTWKHPETNEDIIHNTEGGAICTVSVRENKEDGKVGVNSSVIGAMNGILVESMVEGLIDVCHKILGNVDPMLAAAIMMKNLNKHYGEEEADGMAGESGEPERPTEQ